MPADGAHQEPPGAAAETTRIARARAWGGRQWARTRAGARWTCGKLAATPWKPIAMWAGGIAGVVIVAFVLLVTFADWNALKGPISRFASAASGRPIEIRGDLDVDPWSFTPDVHVTDLRIGNPSRYDERGTFATIAQADLSVRLFPLFIGRLDIVRLDMQGADISLYRGANGDSNWARAPGADRGQPFKLPAIRAFSLRDGVLRLEDDKRRIVLEANFATTERADPRNPGQFTLSGEGQINRQPFSLELTGAPLLNVRRDRPYPFVADVRAGGTRIQADGQITRPFDLSEFRAAVEASGPDLADLYYLLGLTLPNTPPYDLSGAVERRGAVYGMQDISGRVGDSDLRGAFTATRRNNDRLFFDGDFRTNSLDFDDLLAVLGGAPDAGETASPEQRAMAERMAAQGRLLPNARLDISRVRNMDARVSYRAARVRTERLPLRGLSLDISLDQGLLRLDPMTLDLTQGRVNGAVQINAREATPIVDLDARLSNARLENIFPMQGQPALTGVLTGRVRLTGAGAAVREAAANANGEASFAVPSGEIREALAELTGINVVRGLGLLLSDDESRIGVRCGVASFRVRNGVAQAQSILFDTDTMLIRGEGNVSLRDETLNLRLEGDPKEARLISVSAPITIGGRLRDPDIGVEAGSALGQGGIAAALGSLVAPLAAVLPFIDPGLAADANCSALLAGGGTQSQSSGR
ncbi:MAG: AsmA family protein [Hyphomonadaceae bacterium]